MRNTAMTAGRPAARRPVHLAPAFAVALAIAVPMVLAADSGQKPGLWEQHIVKTVIDDGRPSAFAESMAASQRKTRETLALLAATNPKFTNEGNVRECITAEMARHTEPPIRQEPGCEAPVVNRSGDHMNIRSVCHTDGNESNFTLDVSFGHELVRVKADGNIKLANGDTHKVHTETESRYISSVCGGVPPDAPAGAGAPPEDSAATSHP